jgi:hypothetical protein
MAKYSIGESFRECLALFGVVVMAKYSISFSFHSICTIWLTNEKHNVGLIIWKYLHMFGIVCRLIKKIKKTISEGVFTQLSWFNLWEDMYLGHLTLCWQGLFIFICWIHQTTCDHFRYAIFGKSTIKVVSYPFLVWLSSFHYRWESTVLENHLESVWHCLVLLLWLHMVSPSVFIQFALFDLQMKSIMLV